MVLNPVTQYADDQNLRARQALWMQRERAFDLVGWALGLVEVTAGDRILDVGCGNGIYLDELRDRGIDAVGCDLSVGMLASSDHSTVVNGDVTRLPIRDAAFDVVLAPHMLYHVPDRGSAASEIRRVLRPGRLCVAVTNGSGHMASLRGLIEAAARRDTPGWAMRSPSTHAFSLENGAEQMGHAFDEIETIRPDGVGPAVIRDAGIAADYVASIADHYAHEVERPWLEVVEEVRRSVRSVIDADGAFTVDGVVGAFICR